MQYNRLTQQIRQARSLINRRSCTLSLSSRYRATNCRNVCAMFSDCTRWWYHTV